MSGIQEHARVVLGAMLFTGAVKDEYSADEATAEVMKWMAANGVKTIEVQDATGAKMGTLSLGGAGKLKPHIPDMDTVVEWAIREHPSEVQYKPSLRPAFLAKILKDAEANGAPVDTTTGALIPGIEMRPAAPTFSRRPTSEAKDRMRLLVRNRVLPQLPAPGTITTADPEPAPEPPADTTPPAEDTRERWER